MSLSGHLATAFIEPKINYNQYNVTFFCYCKKIFFWFTKKIPYGIK